MQVRKEELCIVKYAVFLNDLVLRVAKGFHIIVFQLKEENLSVIFFPFSYQDPLVQYCKLFFFFAEQDKIR